jgi:major vault protein
MKSKLLKGLGLKGFLVTDGKNPINLFNTGNIFLFAFKILYKS